MDEMLCFGSSTTGEFIYSFLFRETGMILTEGESIQYDEPIPNYHLDKYDPNAKGGISSIKLLPIAKVEYITINFTISPTSSTNEI